MARPSAEPVRPGLKCHHGSGLLLLLKSKQSSDANTVKQRENVMLEINSEASKLQPPPLSPTILCRDQSESMQQAHRDTQLLAGQTGQELQDYVCLKQDLDQKAPHTRS